jgi:Ca-activated chloride channel family protein
VGALVCGAAAQSAEAPEVTFRSNVTEVRLAFSTTDQNNRVVPEVRPTDFAVVDQDRVVREFRSFSRTEFTHMEVAILLDASGSMTPKFKQELSKALELINETGNVVESLSIVSFRGDQAIALCEHNCRSLDVQTQVAALQSGGVTPLYDTIVFASHVLFRHSDEHSRKILILLSDGMDTISIHSLSNAVDSLLHNDVSIYSVDLSPKPHAAEGTPVLRDLAAATGGRYVPVEDGIAKMLDAVREDFRATYTVVYRLPNHAEGFHEVRLLPTHQLGLQFHCRRGYYYPNSED